MWGEIVKIVQEYQICTSYDICEGGGGRVREGVINNLMKEMDKRTAEPTQRQNFTIGYFFRFL